MANQFSSKNTFKFVNTLYKKAKKQAYYDMLKTHRVISKYDFIQRTVDDTLPSTHNWTIGYTDAASRTKRADELWKCGIECHALRYFSPKTLGISSFKKLSKTSGLLAILKAAVLYGRYFTWEEIVHRVCYAKVRAAYVNWVMFNGAPYNKTMSFHTYKTNYYNSYRAYLNSIGAIRQTSKGHWTVTDFGKQIEQELTDWYDKNHK